jgi:hypothetical protein
VAQAEESVHLAWRTVTDGHPDAAALSVLDLLVDNGRSGLLNAALVSQQKVPRASSGLPSFREAGTWVVSAGAGTDRRSRRWNPWRWG